MKIVFAHTIRIAALGASLLVLLVSQFGVVQMQSAGSLTQIGTAREEIVRKLGRPSEELSDGTWLFRSFAAVDHRVTGTLVIRFTSNRVSDLSVVSPAVLTVLQIMPKNLMNHSQVFMGWLCTGKAPCAGKAYRSELPQFR